MRRSGLIALGLVIAGGVAFRRPAAAPPPADAAAPGTPTPPDRIRAEGRLAAYPDSRATVGAEVGGRVVRLAAAEGSVVRRGDVLAELSSDEDRAALAEARARLAEAEAALRLSEADVERDTRLREAQVISTRNLDRSVGARDAERARRDAAGRTVERLDARLAKTRLTAPIGGEVIARDVELGATVAVGTPLFVIADLRRVRVEAEVDEFDAARLRVGAPVTISAEGQERRWSGRVEEIPAAVTGRRLRPQDPARAADTRVLIVKVALDEPVPLRLGQRVEVEIGGTH